jgi:hypothetical protein
MLFFSTDTTFDLKVPWRLIPAPPPIITIFICFFNSFDIKFTIKIYRRLSKDKMIKTTIS